MNNTPVNARPLVAIRCITYNHEPYIRDALEGFVMQKTSFPFVAIVHDDASTDGTAAIIREYAEKYPDIIKPIYETENQYSKHDGSLGRIMNEACDTTGAKYNAMCEGDDYWTDPLKLQKQVDFLESHPDYSMCFHEASIANETNIEFSYPDITEGNYSSEEVFKNWMVPTASIVFCKDRCIRPIDKRFISGDIVLILSCAKFGKIYGLHKKMCTYRVTNTGATIARLQNPIKHYISEINHYKAIYEHFPEITKSAFKKKLSDSYINLGVSLILDNKISGISYIFKSLITDPINFINRIGNLFRK